MFSSNLKYLRNCSGMEQLDLAHRLGRKSASSISEWESGRYTPKIATLSKIASIFNVDLDEMMNVDLSKKFRQTSKKGVKIPILGNVAAGIPIEAIEDILDYEEIPESMARTGEFFALKIKGDSMEPRIQDGDVVIVKKQEDADSSDIVIALVNGEDATCKRLVKYEHGLSLTSNNSVYEPLIFSHEEVEKLPVKIIGKVVELRRKF